MTAATPTSPRSRWTAGRIALVVLGSIAVLIGAGLLAAGAGLLWADQTQRDADGFLSTPTETFRTSSYAIVSETIDLVEADNEGAEWVLSEGVLGDVQVRASAEEPVFVGIGRTRDVNAYLRGVEHDRVTEIDYDPFSVDYRRTAGDAPSAPPAEQDFWAASVSGAGTRTLDWNPEAGEWSVVVMNADATAGVAADVSAGAEANFLLWLAIGLLVAGVVFLAGGGLMIYAGARRTATAAAVRPSAEAQSRRPAHTVYPLAVSGELQPDVSRWLWLVKWLLAIPHYVVLALLWLAFAILTLVAAYVGLMTDEYPPFRLDMGPHEPPSVATADDADALERAES